MKKVLGFDLIVVFLESVLRVGRHLHGHGITAEVCRSASKRAPEVDL